MSVPRHQSDILAGHEICHGFFTRDGGVSTGIYESLNVGLGSNDRPEHIRDNRVRVCSAMGFPEAALRTLYQIHSDRVAILEGEEASWLAPQADALVTRERGLLLGVLTADCAPILAADPEAGVVAAVHAGWKGACGGVMEAAVAAMESLGAERRRIRAAIGPMIAQASYEVGDELRGRFLERDAEFAAFFESGRSDRSYFDLEGFAAARLAAAGVTSIDRLGMDTYPIENRLFSYRRATHRGETDYGRQISVIGMRSA